MKYIDSNNIIGYVILVLEIIALVAFFVWFFMH